MNPILSLILTYTIHYGVVALTYADMVRTWLWGKWLAYWMPGSLNVEPVSRYFLGAPGEDLDTHLVVPPGMVYVEEWVQEGIKKCVVRYTGDTIPRTWVASPFEKSPRTPWIWVGDRDTEIDLTRTFSKFLVVGNRITKDLVEGLIRVTPRTRLIYIEARTFKELDFPGEGLTIEEYGPICDRRPVHHHEEEVSAPVVGERNHPVE